MPPSRDFGVSSILLVSRGKAQKESNTLKTSKGNVDFARRRHPTLNLPHPFEAVSCNLGKPPATLGIRNPKQPKPLLGLRAPRLLGFHWRVPSGQRLSKHFGVQGLSFLGLRAYGAGRHLPKICTTSPTRPWLTYCNPFGSSKQEMWTAKLGTSSIQTRPWTFPWTFRGYVSLCPTGWAYMPGAGCTILWNCAKERPTGWPCSAALISRF